MKEILKAAIVIPIYKTALSAYENISLAQCKAVLSDHTIIFVKPASLNIAAVNTASFPAIFFDDRYFENVHGYNELLMSEIFYRSFSNYEYILIYQLDAFVFSDQLDYWCRQDYDYIGAPWLRLRPYKGIFDKPVSKIKNYLYMRYNVKYKDGLPKIGKQLEDRVGNGGFSLRRVNVFLKYCITHKPLIEHYLAMRHPWFNEDIFWSIELNRKAKRIKKPSLKKALAFAFEINPQRAFKINNNQLPFGCHAWDKNVESWKPIFKQYNYDI